ncbi:MAG: class I SAM-dependent methyltransferase [Chloroflexi bacterium]|nr:class I SAM-dependent methyltransferase [Chloroflexota bacterium]
MIRNNSILAAVVGFLALFWLWQGVVIATEYFLRWKRYRQASKFARKRGKPLLVVGRPGTPLRIYGCGDACIDLDQRVLIDCPNGGLVADIREIPFADGHFGAVFCSHIMEFLPEIAEAEKAMKEMQRVGDRVFLCHTLGPNLVWGWFGPTMRIWVSLKNGDPVFRKRPW